MNIEEWPEGANHEIDDEYTKWIYGVEFIFRCGSWESQGNTSWSLDKYKSYGAFKIIERPLDAPYMPKVGDWCETAGAGARYFYVGVNKDGAHLFEDTSGECIPIGSLEGFRPIKTEREEFIEQAGKSDGGSYSMAAIFGSLYDNGARFTNKP
jgi:hypothetical protein